MTGNDKVQGTAVGVGGQGREEDVKEPRGRGPGKMVDTETGRSEKGSVGRVTVSQTLRS